MGLYVGIDVSKEKFDACGVGNDGKKVFSVTCPMNREGFEKLILQLPETTLIGMESTASYHIALFSYLTAKGYRVAIINPLLIANFAKLSLRKTKTDKKAASTIAEFLLLKKEALAMETEPPRLGELKDLSRRRERLTDQVTALKNDMKRILSVTFPEAGDHHRCLHEIHPSSSYPIPFGSCHAGGRLRRRCRCCHQPVHRKKIGRVGQDAHR
jgi:transposase